MRPERRKRSIMLVIAMLLLAQLACTAGNIDPADPRLQPPVQNIQQLFDQLFKQLGLRPLTDQPLAWITSPDPKSSPAGGSPLTVSGLAYTQADLLSETAPVVELYTLLASGCEGGFTLQQKLGEVSMGSMRAWSMSVTPPAGALVGAVIVVDGQTSPVGNVLAFDAVNWTPRLTSPPDGTNVEINSESALVNLAGTGGPGMCVEVWRGDERLGSAAADANGAWSLPEAPIVRGANELALRVARPEQEIPAGKAVITGWTLEIDWPFGAKNPGEAYQPDLKLGQVTAWYGPNDFHPTIGHPWHDGIDIARNSGQNSLLVRAVADGTVVQVDCASGGLNYVVVDHGAYASRYLHLKDNACDHATEYVKVGSVVYVGDPLATMGDSGTPGAVHLHLTVFRWANGSRDAALKDTKYKWKWTPGELVNVNPANGSTFAGGLTRNFKGCALTGDIWDVDWSQVTVAYSCDPKNYPSGTCFNHIVCPGGVCECK